MTRIGLLETVKVVNGEYLNIEFHQWRVNWSREKLNFQDRLTLDLPIPPKSGVYRARILYSKEIEEIQFIPYQTKEVKTLSLAYDNSLDYSLKYENRDEIERLKSKYLKDSDDILIIKNGLITDTSIANIALFDGENWITPKRPLLKGTTRERLLREKKIIERDIEALKIFNFKKIALMNALMGFYEIDIGETTVIQK